MFDQYNDVSLIQQMGHLSTGWPSLLLRVSSKVHLFTGTKLLQNVTKSNKSNLPGRKHLNDAKRGTSKNKIPEISSPISSGYLFEDDTHLKFIIAPERLPSQWESSLPTTIFQGLCLSFGGVSF